MMVRNNKTQHFNQDQSSSLSQQSPLGKSRLRGASLATSATHSRRRTDRHSALRALFGLGVHELIIIFLRPQ
jgi:hypothetical protein